MTQQNVKEFVKGITEVTTVIKELQLLNMNRIYLSDEEGAYTKDENGEYVDVRYVIIAVYTNDEGEERRSTIGGGVSNFDVYRALAELIAVACGVELEVSIYFEANKYTSN